MLTISRAELITRGKFHSQVPPTFAPPKQRNLHSCYDTPQFFCRALFISFSIDFSKMPTTIAQHHPQTRSLAEQPDDKEMEKPLSENKRMIGGCIRRRSKKTFMKLFPLLSPLPRRRTRKYNTTKASLLGEIVTNILDDTEDDSDNLSTTSCASSSAPLPAVIPVSIHNEDGSSNDEEQQRRTVRFHLSKNVIVKPDITEESGRQLTDPEIHDCWWTVQERYEIVATFREDIEGYLKRQEEQQKVQGKKEGKQDGYDVNSLSRIVRKCNEFPNDILEQHDNIVTTIYQLMNDDNTSRGMELEIAPLLKILRQKHSHAVLDYYHNRMPSHFQSDLKARMLSSRSVQYSRPFEILARIQGEVDALLAAATN